MRLVVAKRGETQGSPIRSHLRQSERVSEGDQINELNNVPPFSAFRFLRIKRWHERHKIMTNDEVEEAYQAFFKKVGW